MTLPDEIALKDEIKEIADKIDAIINTVNKVYPMKQNPDLELNENSKPQDNWRSDF